MCLPCNFSYFYTMQQTWPHDSQTWSLPNSVWSRYACVVLKDLQADLL